VLVVSEKGYGKRSAIMDEAGEYAYRMVNRGGKGVKTLQVTDKIGALIAIKDVKDDDQLMIINRSGLTIRMGLDEMRVLGRATQGVRLIELRKNDQIAAVAKIDSELKEDELPEDLEEGEGQDGETANGTDVAETSEDDTPSED
jgi:DNA gyrase subunit A